MSLTTIVLIWIVVSVPFAVFVGKAFKRMNEAPKIVTPYSETPAGKAAADRAWKSAQEYMREHEAKQAISVAPFADADAITAAILADDADALRDPEPVEIGEVTAAPGESSVQLLDGAWTKLPQVHVVSHEMAVPAVVASYPDWDRMEEEFLISPRVKRDGTQKLKTIIRDRKSGRFVKADASGQMEIVPALN